MQDTLILDYKSDGIESQHSITFNGWNDQAQKRIKEKAIIDEFENKEVSFLHVWVALTFELSLATVDR